MRWISEVMVSVNGSKGILENGKNCCCSVQNFNYEIPNFFLQEKLFKKFNKNFHEMLLFTSNITINLNSMYIFHVYILHSKFKRMTHVLMLSLLQSLIKSGINKLKSKFPAMNLNVLKLLITCWYFMVRYSHFFALSHVDMEFHLFHLQFQITQNCCSPFFKHSL